MHMSCYHLWYKHRSDFFECHYTVYRFERKQRCFLVAFRNNLSFSKEMSGDVGMSGSIERARNRGMIMYIVGM
jgi:hypothetical protein